VPPERNSSRIKSAALLLKQFDVTEPSDIRMIARRIARSAVVALASIA
jgi:hypothetical protein